jgi:hypothetical protein
MPELRDRGARVRRVPSESGQQMSGRERLERANSL